MNARRLYAFGLIFGILITSAPLASASELDNLATCYTEVIIGYVAKTNNVTEDEARKALEQTPENIDLMRSAAETTLAARKSGEDIKPKLQEIEAGLPGTSEDILKCVNASIARTAALPKYALDGKDLLCQMLDRAEPWDFNLQGYYLYRFSSPDDGLMSVSQLYVETDTQTHELGFEYQKVIGIKKFESTYRYKDFPNTIVFGDMRRNVIPGLGKFEDWGFEEAVVSAEDLARSVKIGLALNMEFDGDIFRINRETLILESISEFGNLGFKYSCSLISADEVDSTINEMESQYREFYNKEFDNLLLENAPSENKL